MTGAPWRAGKVGDALELVLSSLLCGDTLRAAEKIRSDLLPALDRGQAIGPSDLAALCAAFGSRVTR